MRTEELQKEAALFDKEHECYIHIQKTADQPYACIIAGDPVTIIQGIYNQISYLETDLGVPFDSIMKSFKKIKRKCGINNHMEDIEEEKE